MNTTNPLALFRISDKIASQRARDHRTHRQRMRDAMLHIAEITSEGEAITIWANNIPVSPRLDVTADFAELIAWAVSRRVIMDNIESPLWIVDAQTDEEDYQDLIDTQECARC